MSTSVFPRKNGEELYWIVFVMWPLNSLFLWHKW